jgi:hypothetical protein
MKRLLLTAILGVIFGLLLVHGAHAQLPTSIQPNGQGGYNVYTPGQYPQQVIPNGMGGYWVSPPVYVAPVQPPIYNPQPLPAPYMPQGYQPFNGRSAGAQMYGR